MTLDKGSHLGPYEIVGLLGSGGMGEVYRARDTRLGREVAVKILPTEYADQHDRVRRFEREARAVAALNHPNILILHDIGTHNGAPYLVTELLEGQSLRDLLAEGPLPIRTAMDIGVQVAEGLAAAHEKGVVHRDLKPDNLFITKDGRVKILDFGLARLRSREPLPEEGRSEALTLDNPTREGAILGTPGYMAPEQVRGFPVDARTDIFAVGCVLYEILSGRSAFKGETKADALSSVLVLEPKPLSEVRPQISRALERVVFRCIEKKPEDRYQSTRDLVTEMRRMPPFRGSHILEWVKAHEVSLLAIAVSLMAILGATALLVPKSNSIKSSSNVGPLTVNHGNTRIAPAVVQWNDSIAVLPFKNMSPDPRQEYFCDGMTEQVITFLSQVKDLKVIARTSVMGFKKTDEDIRQIAKELNVQHVLEGSVRRIGSRVRVTAQLIRADDGSHVWSREYNRQVQDVFAVQDEIAQAITDVLKLRTGGGPLMTAQDSRPTDIDAYDCYLKGRYLAESVYMVSHREKDFQEALKYGKKAIEIDPTYAFGYLGLALTCTNHAIVTNASDNMWEEALEYYKRAHELLPNSALTAAGYGYALIKSGDFEEGLTLIKKGVALNQNESFGWLFLGLGLHAIGLQADAVKCERRSVELDPRNYWAITLLGHSLCSLGQWKEALQVYKRGLQLQPAQPGTISGCARACLVGGELEDAERWIVRLEGCKGWEGRARHWRALYLASRGQERKALRKGG